MTACLESRLDPRLWCNDKVTEELSDAFVASGSAIPDPSERFPVPTNLEMKVSQSFWVLPTELR